MVERRERSSERNHPALLEGHLRALQEICVAFRNRGTWPSFTDIDRRLSREDLDLAELLNRLVPGYVHRDGNSSVPHPDEYLRLNVAGLRRCPDAEGEINLFLRALTWMVQREFDYDPPFEGPSEPVVSSAEAIGALVLPAATRERDLGVIYALVQEEPLLWSAASGGPGAWTFTLSRTIRSFKGIRNAFEYVEKSAELRGDTGPRATVRKGFRPYDPIYGISQHPRSTMSEPLRTTSAASRSPAPDPRKVFVVHGRDSDAREALFSFLRVLDLHPLEWEELVAATGSGSPFTGEVVARAFAEAQAVVVLFTPDDEARLHPSLHGPNEPEYETKLVGQPRPNVLLEAGMAFGAQPTRTILVELGDLRPVSDLTGRNAIRLGSTPDPLQALVQRLRRAGCAVNDASPAWMDAKRFANLPARRRRSTREEGSP
jgi:predicted nucleotide-binding protein